METDDSKQVLRFIKLAIILLFTVLFIIYTLSLNAKNVPTPSYEPSAEPHLALTNTELLKANLTTIDYIAYQDRLRDFITYNNLSPTSQVDIISVTPSERVGSVTKIVIRVPDLQNKELTTYTDYAEGENGSFSVPDNNYKTSLYGVTYN